MDKQKYRWLAVFVGWLLWSALPAQGNSISLSGALDYATQHAELAQMAVLEQQSQQYLAHADTAFTRPQLKASARYIEMDTNGETGVSFLELPSRELEAKLQFSQLVFGGGRISAGKSLERVRQNQSQLSQTLSLRGLHDQVKTAFDHVLFQKAVVEIQKDRLRQRLEELDDARALWEAGMVTRLDIRQAQLSTNLARDALQKAQSEKQQAVVHFNTTIGHAPLLNALVPEGKLAPLTGLPVLLDQTQRELEQNSLLDLRSELEKVQNARLQYEFAGGERWPQVALVSSLASQGENLGEMDETVAAGVQIQWSILDGRAIDSKRSAARVTLQRSQKALLRAQKKIGGSLAGIKIRQSSLTRRMGLQRKSVTLAFENYEDARGQYRAGTITLTRLGGFNLAHTEAQFGLLRIYFEQRQIHHRVTSILTKPKNPYHHQ